MRDPGVNRAGPQGSESGHVDVRSARRGFSLSTVTALSLVNLRPIAIFAIVPSVVALGGLGSWVAFPVLLALVLVVALVFAELSSKWPLEGSVYEWSRQLIGPRSGWMTGWLYLCAYTVISTYLACSVSQRIFTLFDDPAPGWLPVALVAAALVVVAMLVNSAGRSVVKWLVLVVAGLSVAVCVGVSTVLLVAHQIHPFSSLFQFSSNGVHGISWWTGPFLVAAAAAGVFRGFEMPAEVAEEVNDPERNVPRAIVWSFSIASVLVLYSAIALFLANPTEVAVTRGAATIGTIDAVTGALGVGYGRAMSAMVVLGFFATLVIAQMAASRTVWSTARDRVFPAHRFFESLSRRDRLPLRAIGLVGLVALVLPFIFSTNSRVVFYGAAVGALLFAYLIPILGALRSRLSGTWRPGPWTLGWFGVPAIVVAAGWLVVVTVNAMWPRHSMYGLGFGRFSPLVLLGATLVSGLAISFWAFRDHGIHTRHFDHVELDMEPSRLLHAGTCASCFRVLTTEIDVYVDPVLHTTTCDHCHDLALHVRDNPGATDADMLEVAGHDPSGSTLERVRHRGWHPDHGAHPHHAWKAKQ